MKLFETIRCEGGEAKHLEYHRRRIRRSVGRDFLLEAWITPPGSGLLRCKVIYDADRIYSVEYFPYTRREVRSFRLLPTTLEYGRKYLDRDALDALYGRRESADEILLVRDGLLTDTSIANIALQIDGVWLTPEIPLLAGTTRERLLDHGLLHLWPLTPSHLKQAEKFALLNAMIGLDILPAFEIVAEVMPAALR